MGRADVVVAAGGVVWRRTAKGKLRVLLVHRPKYDDWSFPKGKLEPNEHVLAGAVREILEETGLHVRIGRRLAAQEYTVKLSGGAGTAAKLVHYWSAQALNPGVEFTPNKEVDEAVWLSVRKARALLSYAHDIDLLGELPAEIEPVSTVVVLRHAPATKRKDFTGSDDNLRPLLDGRGYACAKHLIEPLSALGVDRILSSPALRCRQTVQPYAETADIDIELVPQISETGHAAAPGSMAGLHDHVWRPGRVTLVCSHRPVLGALAKELDVRVGKYAAGDFLVAHRFSDGSQATERFSAP